MFYLNLDSRKQLTDLETDNSDDKVKFLKYACYVLKILSQNN